MSADSAFNEPPTTVNCFALNWPKRKVECYTKWIASVALAVGALFTLSFLCIAIIASARGTPFPPCRVGRRRYVVGRDDAAFLVLRAQRPGQSFQTLGQEVQRDLEPVKEVIK